MSQPTNDFIGNSTLLDTLLTDYKKPFHKYNDDDFQVEVTAEQHDSLKEIQRHLFNDSVAVSSGVEAIGHFISSADFDRKGVNNQSIENLGYLVEYLGRQMVTHTYQVSCISDELMRVVIKD